MKLLLRLAAFVTFGSLLFYFSCKKEFSCENCRGNMPPNANAGNDTSITLPSDSIWLDGSLSSDPDDGIANYEWKKISGPDTFYIDNNNAVKTTVNKLGNAVYIFELTIIDKGGLSDKDTMQVMVNPVVTTNRPPVANAGNDSIILLPANSVMLNGSKSMDPDNNISNYEWTKISGPPTFNITSANSPITQVINLSEGTYRFELKVTDAGGLISLDTVQVILNAIINVSSCPPSNRPIINTKLVPIGTLSEARTMISVASAGNKILFAGGLTPAIASPIVDIYDITTQSWSTAKLSTGRFNMVAISVGNKIYFAGGQSTNYKPSSRIDIYDIASNSWSIAELSEPRSSISVATVGTKIMFAGGSKHNASLIIPSDKVDIYDITTNAWSTATLSVAREGLSATTAGNKIYFAGGHDFSIGTGVYDNIDIYDNSTNTWTTSLLSERKSHHGAFTMGNYIYWAGGETWNNYNDYETTCMVERRDLSNGTSTFLHLFQPSYAHGNDQPAMVTLLKNESIVFYTGGYLFDIYDPIADMWSIGKMNQAFDYAGVISVKNDIYIAGGGGFRYNTPVSKQVWKLEF